MALPRMRTATGVLAIIKEHDPATEVTLHYIRRLISTNKVPVTLVGCKKLVDADTVISYIAAGEQITHSAPEPDCGMIRRVPV